MKNVDQVLMVFDSFCVFDKPLMAVLLCEVPATVQLRSFSRCFGRVSAAVAPASQPGGGRQLHPQQNNTTHMVAEGRHVWKMKI